MNAVKRCMEFSCGIGDTVYYISHKRIMRDTVCYIVVNVHGARYKTGYGPEFGENEIGISVFFTREEAEKLLKEEK